MQRKSKQNDQCSFLQRVKTIVTEGQEHLPWLPRTTSCCVQTHTHTHTHHTRVFPLEACILMYVRKDYTFAFKRIFYFRFTSDICL